jgi:exosortase/archaeosortase family protein
MIRFAVAFILVTLLLRWETLIEVFRKPYCELLASSLSGFFSLLGMDIWRSEATVLSHHGNGFTVIPDCDGLILIGLFLAGVVAAPLQETLSPYLKALAIVVILIIVNWFRLLGLALVGFFQPGLFELMHGYVVQGVLILISIGLFFAWLNVIMPEEPAAAPNLSDS